MLNPDILVSVSSSLQWQGFIKLSFLSKSKQKTQLPAIFSPSQKHLGQAERLKPASADYMVAVVSIFDFIVTFFPKENAKVSMQLIAI